MIEIETPFEAFEDSEINKPLHLAVGLYVSDIL